MYFYVLMFLAVVFVIVAAKYKFGTYIRYYVESQNGDTGQWEVMAETDDLEQARSLLTSRYRRICDRRTGQQINFQ